MTRLAGPLGNVVTYSPAGNETPGFILITSGGGKPVMASAKTATANGGLLLRRAIWEEIAPAQREAAERALREATARALDPSGRLLEAARLRRAAAVARLAGRGRVVRVLRVRPVWRVVIGLGEQTPAEIGMSVHGTYGVPVLPGSALKGAARACAREDYPESYGDYGRIVFGKEPGEARRAGEETGTDEDAGESTGDEVLADGRFMFLDALPELSAKAAGTGVEIDIMNPHVPEYYGDPVTAAPAEYQQPVPVAFYTVTSAVTFTIYLVGRGHDPDLPELAASDDEDGPVAWLSTALRDRGLGAKTNAGYGYFSVEIADTAETAAAGPARPKDRR